MILQKIEKAFRILGANYNSVWYNPVWCRAFGCRADKAANSEANENAKQAIW